MYSSLGGSIKASLFDRFTIGRVCMTDTGNILRTGTVFHSHYRLGDKVRSTRSKDVHSENLISGSIR